MSAAGSRLLDEVRASARSAGLAPALTALTAAVLPGFLPCGPGGHAVVPSALLAEPAKLWFDGEPHGPAEAGPVTAHDLPGGPVTAVSFSRVAPPARTTPAVERLTWWTGLLAVRLGLSEGLRDTARRYLAGRRVGDSFALHQQMVKADLAAAAIRQEETAAALPAADLDESALGYLHTAVTDADRLLAPLLGASGYLRGTPGHAADVSELLADAHLPVRSAA